MRFVFIDKCQSLRPEMNEDEGSKEQTLSCVQDTSEVADLSSRDKAVKKTDPIRLLRYFIYFS